MQLELGLRLKEYACIMLYLFLLINVSINPKIILIIVKLHGIAFWQKIPTVNYKVT